MRRTDPLIVGAGPAGCAAALVLANADRRALVIERTVPVGDALCGGFLSWRTLASLDRLGIGCASLGGHPITRIRLFGGKRSAEASLPGGAIGLSRYRLDSVMRQAAEARGAGIETGIQAREIESDAVRLADGTRLTGDALFLATGKHDLRGVARDRAQGDPAMGLRLRLPPHPALSALIGDSIELHLFEGGYAGLLLQEDGSANLCIAVRKSRLTESGGQPRQLLARLGEGTPLGERLAHASTSPIDAVGAVPYGWRAHATTHGLFRLGDQAAVIPSLAGEGIGIAVASGAAAARAYLSDGPAGAPGYQKAFAQRAARPVTIARTLWKLAERPMLAGGGVSTIGWAPWLAGLAAHLTRIGD